MRFNMVWASGISFIGESLFLRFFFFLIHLVRFLVSISNINELSLKEEDHLRDVVNYSIHAFSTLSPPKIYLGLVLVPT